TSLQTVKKLIPLSLVPGWGKDFASPFGFDFFIFGNAGLGCTTATNYALAGFTADNAKECGVEDAYNAAVAKYGPIPGVSDAIDACVTKPSDQVNQCFADDVDKPLMETVVPWVPWSWANNLVITGTSVTNYEYDANAGVISFSWTAVDDGIAPVNVAAWSTGRQFETREDPPEPSLAADEGVDEGW